DWLAPRRSGDVSPVRTPAGGMYMREPLDTATEVLAARGARVVLLTSPCFGQPESGLSGIPERSDAARVQDLNHVFRTYARAHPTRISILDLHGFLCPHRPFAPPVGGVPARAPAGPHLSPGGAKVVWQWLAGRLRTEGLLRSR